MPVVFVSMKVFHAPGNESRRSVWPVGAVSKTTWSYSVAVSAEASTRVNSSKAAISIVHAPESCSSMRARAAAGSTPRYGPTTRSR